MKIGEKRSNTCDSISSKKFPIEVLKKKIQNQKQELTSWPHFAILYWPQFTSQKHHRLSDEKNLFKV